MSCEITSRTLSSQFNQDSKRFESSRDEALQKGNIEEAARYEQLNEIVDLGREKLQRAGFSLGQFRVLKGGKEGNTVALGAYQQDTESTGPIALADAETFAEGSLDAEDAAGKMVKGAEHEMKHFKSHAEALQKGVAGEISRCLGPEMHHVLQESMASEETTEDFDAYDQERREASAFARQIGSSRQSINRLLLDGEEDKIVSMARDAEYQMAA